MQLFSPKRTLWQRIWALLLCAVMLLTFVPDLRMTKAQALNWADPYLELLTSWNVMRGDETGLSPQRDVTRAEFIAMTNRAFGYTKNTTHPFTDVLPSDWYSDDIGIAYNVGYFTGTSDRTANPREPLSREEAATMICRNLMLKPGTGENLTFTDSRLASSWSRGYIKAASDAGILLGYEDGTFRPQNNIKRSEVAAILTRVIGQPIQNPGTYSQSVAGNLTVATSGVTLENMSATGDLIVSPGVGLGHIDLNNVEVLGNIIASGSGESNKGEPSIIFKNSVSSNMIVDSPSNQYVTLRALGNTNIEKTYVRTPTYIEDKSRNRYGLQYIEIDGEEGTKLDLAGNIHEVLARSPGSEIVVGKGSVEKMTIDEEATESTVTIDEEALVEEMNLDVATIVEGKGDITKLTINAPGCEVEMMPDIISIRPGITAVIAGVTMGTNDAMRASDSPKILSGYPRVQDIAPTQATAAFKTNKLGTIYWAVRLSGEGNMNASDLISPPSYGGNIIKSGNFKVKKAQSVDLTKLTGLKLDTSYVLSAVLQDEQGKNSPVKNIYFTTPDSSKPNFSSGYPRLSKVEDTFVHFDVAATKNCTLYWAVYKKGMQAPTINNFKDGTLPGAIDSGKENMIRSEEIVVGMGDSGDLAHILQELGEYEAYFFLTDGVNDSAIKKISFTTADRTPPIFHDDYPRVSKIAAKALTIEAMINENGTIYWAAVKHGAEYPVKKEGLTAEALLLDQQLQIKGGMFAGKSGSVKARKDTIARINISGLDIETAYDIYFIAEDNAGNLSAGKRPIAMVQGKTLDSNPPKVLPLEFTVLSSDNRPMADTGILIHFNEDVYDSSTRSLVEIYQNNLDGNTWRNIIINNFELRDLSARPNAPINWDKVLPENEDAVKDLIIARLDENGCTVIEFTHEALQLKSGNKYQFFLSNLRDEANNIMPQKTPTEQFQTMYAQVMLDDAQVSNGNVLVFDDEGKPIPEEVQETDAEGNPVFNEDGSPKMVPKTDENGNIIYKVETDEKGNEVLKQFDMSFLVDPVLETTNQMTDSIKYDIIMTSNTNIEINLYARRRYKDTEDIQPGWTQIANNIKLSFTPRDEPWVGRGLNSILGLDTSHYNAVNKMEYAEYAVELVAIDGITNRTAWDADITMYVMCAAGTASNLFTYISGRAMLWESDWKTGLDSGSVSSIGEAGSNTDVAGQLKLVAMPRNTTSPQFQHNYPFIYPGDSVANINVMLDRVGMVHWVIAKYGPKDKPDQANPALPAMERDESQGNKLVDIPLEDIEETKLGALPNSGLILKTPGEEPSETNPSRIASPTAESIISKSFGNDSNIQQGRYDYNGSSSAQIIHVEGLQPNTIYLAYFVLQGSSSNPSLVYCFQFTTGDVNAPYVTVMPTGASAEITVTPPDDQTIDANVNWWLYSSTKYPAILKEKITVPTEAYETAEGVTTDEKEMLALSVLMDTKVPDRFNKWGDPTTDSSHTDAAETFKDRLWNYLTSPSNAEPAPVQHGTSKVTTSRLNPASIIVVDPEKMIEGTPYLLIVATQNTLGGPYVFNVVSNLIKKDFTIPYVVSMSTSGTNAHEDANGNMLYDVSLTIKFNTDLYVAHNINDIEEPAKLFTKAELKTIRKRLALEKAEALAEAQADDTGTDDPGTGGSGTDDPGTGGTGTEEPGTGGTGTEEPGTGGTGTEEPNPDDISDFELTEELKKELLEKYPLGILPRPVIISGGSNITKFKYYVLLKNMLYINSIGDQKITIAGGDTEGFVRTLQLTVKGFQVNDSFTFDSRVILPGRLCDEDGSYRRENPTFYLIYERDKNGEPIPEAPSRPGEESKKFKVTFSLDPNEKVLKEDPSTIETT